MSAAPITCVCVSCHRAWVSNARHVCAFGMGGCGGRVVDLPAPLPNDSEHISDKYFLRDQYVPRFD